MSEGDPKNAGKIVLQPSNSTSISFQVKRDRSIFSPPTTYVLGAEVEYKVDSRLQRMATEREITLRPQLGYLLIGAIVGSLVGFFAKNSDDIEWLLAHITEHDATTWVQQSSSLLLATILGVVVVILSRFRTGGVTVEDFVGATIVGFTVVVAGIEIADVVQGMATDIGGE